jgi:hypothetical protein
MGRLLGLEKGGLIGPLGSAVNGERDEGEEDQGEGDEPDRMAAAG